jgi:signal transduction histidine kinase/DNA-binding response OmpR family regulator
MMEGFDRDWLYVGTKREAVYTNLAPGEYTFRVKAANNDGVWNEQGASIKVIIAPPFWRTWWAYTLYVLFMMGLLFGIRRYELNRMRLKDQVKIKHLEAEKLKELDAMKSRFFSNISHEFRTPLTLILGPIENMLAKITDKQSNQDLSLMHKNATNLLRLVNQLLDLARLESGKMRLQASRGDLMQCLKSIVAAFESLARSRNVTLHFHSQVESLEAWFNREHLETVFYNLLSNAFKFTPEGGEVSVQLSVISNQLSLNQPITDHSSLITVKDTGIGIPTDKLRYVFDRFYQAESASTQTGAARKFEGTGIGLSLVKELVELHHGKVEITSEEGKGTEVVVRLPLGREHLQAEEIVSEQLSVSSDQLSVGSEQGAIASATQRSSHPEIHQSSDPTIQPSIDPDSDEEIVLIVEDNADMRAYIRRNLENGYKVVEAQNGQEGLEKAMAMIPDMIISDVMMPVMDGYALCDRLKSDEKTSHIPVILLTARAGREDKLEGLETGADDYLTKPFDAEELQIRVKNLIALRRKLQEKFKKQMVLQPSEISITSVDEAFLKKAVAMVEEHLEDESFSPDDLAHEVGMSRAQFYRKLRALTDQPAGHFIRAIRLQRAADLLKQGFGNITEIAYKVGFSSQPYFTKCFQEYFGVSPKEYKDKNS